LYRSCPFGLDSIFVDSDKENVKLNRISKKIVSYHYNDFTGLRNKSIESEEILNFLDSVSEQLA